MKKIAFVFGTGILFLNSSYSHYYYLKDDFSFIHGSDRSGRENFTNYLKIESLNFDFSKQAKNSIPNNGQLELVLSAKNLGQNIYEQLINNHLITKLEIASGLSNATRPISFCQFENIKVTSYNDNYNDVGFIKITVLYDRYVYFYISTDGNTTKNIGWDFVNECVYP